MWQRGWRDRIWADLDRKWDLIVIGGGITGAGIMREAARAGLRVLLLEADDFASGTSSRSSKLVHGGLRYLRNGQIRTTMASVHERERLLKEGRGLITPLGFLFVAYEGDKVPLSLMGAGLAVYDLLGMRWGHKRYSSDALARLAPDLETSGLVGGYRYFDAQTDDARLVFRVIREGVRDGGTALNYARVVELLQTNDGHVHGVTVQDRSGERDGRLSEVKARLVVNATGAGADKIRAQLGLRVGSQKRLRTLRGSHLVFAGNRLPIGRAISFAHPVDGRPVFTLPWEGVTLFGTTDVDHTGQTLRIDDSEIDYLLSALNYAFPDLALSEDDVQGTFSGVRAVVHTGKSDPSKESREHVLWQEEGLLTVTGGKLTTFRVMAKDALRAARQQLSGKPHFRGKQLFDDVEPLAKIGELSPVERIRLSGRYGSDAHNLIEVARPGELSSIAGSVCLWAELRWAARSEGVVHLDDLLLRRVRLGLLLPEGGMAEMVRIRQIVQPELDWDDERWEREELDYANHWQRYHYLPGRGPSLCQNEDPDFLRPEDHSSLKAVAREL